MKTNSGKKGSGMPVVRNPQFYFKEGFCWNNVLTTNIKCKFKEKTVQSTESMSFFSCSNKTPEYYMIAIMNSIFVALYVDNFINSTSHCTTGDAKLIPIIIPTDAQLKEIKEIFSQAFEIRKKIVSSGDVDNKMNEKLSDIEKLNDQTVAHLYQI